MRLCIAVALMPLLVGCGSSSNTAIHAVVQVDRLPRVDVEITIDVQHERAADRFRYAALTTLKTLGTWLAPFPDSTLAVTADRSPWWTAPAAMTEEYAVARPVSRRYWQRVIDTRALPSWFVDGLAEYAARRAVSHIVDERYFAVDRSRLEVRYFGGFIPRDLRVPLRVEDEGDPVPEYFAHPRSSDPRALAAKTLLTLGTFERWTGRPVFDAVLEQFVRASSSPPTIDDFVGIASRVSGQDLAWLFDQTLGSRGVIDYGIDRFRSRQQPDGSYLTTVVARRFGDGMFTGTGAAPQGPFERGRGVALLTTFDDGLSVRDVWDGRSAEKTFEYRSKSAAVSAEVDPERVMLLDADRTNNGMRRDTASARTAAIRWAARWAIWMQDALLAYVSLT